MEHDLGHRLAMVRHARRLSQVELAKQAGITQKHLSQLETGTRPFLSLASGTIVRLAQVLQVSTDYLLGIKETLEGEWEPAVVELIGV